MLDSRVPLALGASLLLHGAALALADRLPVGWQKPGAELGEWGMGALHARLSLGASAPQPSPAVTVTAPDRAARGREGARAAPTAPSGVLAAPVYVPAEQLDERPQIRSHIEPAFPLDANAAAGRVVLRLLIDERGNVDKAIVLDGEPASPFAVAAVEAFSPARFSPGRKDGVAVKSALSVELNFGAAPATSSGLRRQDVPLFQPPRPSPGRHRAHAQEKS